MHLPFDISHLHHTAEQHYVELMFQASHLYASWEPLNPVRLGDYGKLERDHSFSREGNIFDDGLAEELRIEEQVNAEDSVRFIQSETAEEKSLSVDAGGSYGPVQAGIKKSFKISDHHGAILAMVKPRHHSLSFPGRLSSLLARHSWWSHRVIVTELYTCYSYARLYAPRQERLVEVSLDASTPINAMHGKGDLHWQTTAQSCDFKHRDVEEGEVQSICYPLFKLVGRHHHLHHGPYTEVRYDKHDDLPFDHRVAAVTLPGVQSTSMARSSSMLSHVSSATTAHVHW